jgi:hypothetical protein
MIRKSLLAIAAGALALSGCATTPSRIGICDAQPGQLFVGQKAEAASGLAIRRATGSSLIRWAPPRSALTMDFQEGRVTVAYDDAMTITAVACG